MQDIWQLMVGTITMRPYVFAFFVVYLVAAVTHLGLRTTFFFTLAGYLIAFLSELSSINTGFPYGWYSYVDATKNQELWVVGVPFFDSLSYVFLAYCSYALALLVVSPLKGWHWNLVPLENRSIRSSFSILFLGSLFQVFLDIVIDPVALQGKRWFLGQIYSYQEQGVHFGVPLSNYLGWWGVSALMILVLQRLDAGGKQNMEKPFGTSSFPFRILLGPLLYVTVVIFNLTVSFLLDEYLMGITGIFIFSLPLALILVSVIRRINRYSKEDLAEHLRDYPWSPISGRRG